MAALTIWCVAAEFDRNFSVCKHYSSRWNDLIDRYCYCPMYEYHVCRRYSYHRPTAKSKRKTKTRYFDANVRSLPIHSRRMKLCTNFVLEFVEICLGTGQSVMGLEIDCHVHTLIQHSTRWNGYRHQILQAKMKTKTFQFKYSSAFALVELTPMPLVCKNTNRFIRSCDCWCRWFFSLSDKQMPHEQYISNHIVTKISASPLTFMTIFDGFFYCFSWKWWFVVCFACMKYLER